MGRRIRELERQLAKAAMRRRIRELERQLAKAREPSIIGDESATVDYSEADESHSDEFIDFYGDPIYDDYGDDPPSVYEDVDPVCEEFEDDLTEKASDVSRSDASGDLKGQVVSATHKGGFFGFKQENESDVVCQTESLHVLWQSFDHPTNTWLPGGKVGYKKHKQETQKLVAWRSLKNPVPGRYSIEVDKNGTSHLLSWNQSKVFWSSGPWNGKFFSQVPEIQLDYFVTNMTYIVSDEENYFAYEAAVNSTLTRFIIDVQVCRELFVRYFEVELFLLEFKSRGKRKRVRRLVCSTRYQLKTSLINILFNMYIEFGLFDEAWKLFDKMPERNMVSWTTMISALSNSGMSDNSPELSENEDMDVDMSQNVSAERHSTPYFLNNLEDVQGNPLPSHSPLVAAVHTLLVNSGFIRLDSVTGAPADVFLFLLDCNTPAKKLSLRYTLSKLVESKNAAPEFVIVNLHKLGCTLVIHGSLNGNESKPHYASKMELLMRKSCEILDNSGANENLFLNLLHEKEVFEFYKEVKDKLALPLLIDICVKVGFPLPPCLMLLPTGLKLQIFELVSATCLAKLACQCTELRYLTSENSLRKMKYVKHCGKIRALEKLMFTWITEGDKVLLFSYSFRMLDILEKFLIRKGYSFSRLDGSTPRYLRQSLVDKFNSSPSKWVFLISSSRWADVVGSPRDVGEIADDDDDLRRRRKLRQIPRTDSYEGGFNGMSSAHELRKEGSVQNPSNLSDPEEYEKRSSSSSKDNSVGSGSEKRNMMDSNEENDYRGSVPGTSSSDSEDEDHGLHENQDPAAPPARSVNMLLACRSVDEFEKLNKIDEGTYGVVYRARYKKSVEIVALKKVKMEKEMEGFPLTSLREINILFSFHHQSIVDVKEVVVGSSLDSIFVVMEYMEHDLKGLMEAMKQSYSQSEVKCLMVHWLEGIRYLHDNWVIHRDVKTSNLLLNNRDELALNDLKAKGRWNCGWHLCSKCENNAQYMCFTCIFSLCQGSIKDTVFYSIRVNKGLCETCLKTINLIKSKDEPEGTDSGTNLFLEGENDAVTYGAFWEFEFV